MKLSDALHIERTSVVSIVGAGGKTTALFLLAGEITPPVFITTTTHLSTGQAKRFKHWIVVPEDASADFFSPFLHLRSPVLFTGERVQDDRVKGLSEKAMQTLLGVSAGNKIPVIIEADGSRQLPIKAPASHEPAIPSQSTIVIVMAGMSALGKSIESGQIHRPDEFARVAGGSVGEVIDEQKIINWAVHPGGGLKNIPAAAERVLLLNQCDSDEELKSAGWIAKNLLSGYSTVIAASLQAEERPIKARFEKIAAVILAAGAASRYGEVKQLLPVYGMPLVRLSASTALLAGCESVVAVVGYQKDSVAAALNGLPVEIVQNPDWSSGQGSSVAAGMRAVMKRSCGAVIFMLADQPLDNPLVIRSLIEAHQTGKGKIILPDFDGRRGNPTLFDREYFLELSNLSGEVGGRQVMKGRPIHRVPWLDPVVLRDIDEPIDYSEVEERK